MTTKLRDSLSNAEQKLVGELSSGHRHVRLYRVGKEVHLRRQAMYGSCTGWCCAEYFVIRVGAQKEETMTTQELQIAKLRYLLYEAIVELEYVQASEDHSLCASAKGREIVERGMKLLEVKDLSQEHLVEEQEENTK